MKQIERLLLCQGYRCFFCDQPVPPGQASVEHLVAIANGGTKHDENCVVCCAFLNSALGNLPVKEKLRIVLNQRGPFTCPLRRRDSGAADVPALAAVPEPIPSEVMAARVSLVLDHLRQLTTNRPRRITTLTNLLNALFQRKLSRVELDLLVEALRANGYISVEGAAITYTLPQPPGDASESETA
ncbi:MAG: hypothetical protein J5I93_05225 [Pirellulaceae bacterium]|nr:hypothetical protein [Pirellulaceae bacterium]